jgi:hypothetical protein
MGSAIEAGLMATMRAAIDHSLRELASAQLDELAPASVNETAQPRGKHVIGPDERRLTLADLPLPDTKRWVIQRKAEVVAAVRDGLLSLEEACTRYALSSDEILSWQRCSDRFGLAGLRTTWTQFYLRGVVKAGEFETPAGSGCVGVRGQPANCLDPASRDKGKTPSPVRGSRVGRSSGASSGKVETGFPSGNATNATDREHIHFPQKLNVLWSIFRKSGDRFSVRKCDKRNRPRAHSISLETGCALGDMEGNNALPYPDLAQALQARILADVKAAMAGHAPHNRPDSHEGRTVEALEAQIATLEEAVTKAQALGEQRRREAETAAKRVEALEAKIATLEKAGAKAEALGEQRRREAETAATRADDLVAELIEMTSELVEISKRMAEQAAATEKVRAEFDAYRSRTWWWRYPTG